MRCMRIRKGEGLDRLKLEEADEPGSPGPGEIKVRVKACSLNYHDYAVCAGMMETQDGRVPMADGAGEVEEIGEGVTGFRTGDRVVSVFFPQWQDGEATEAGFGKTPGDGVDGFAQEVVVRPASAFTHAPEGWDHAQSACLPTAALTAWRALVVEGGLKAGDTVVTMGTGGVSIFALQMARAMGARVIATSSSDEKRERLDGLGAVHTINYEKTESWGETVRELTGGRGADLVVEVGGPATLPHSIKALRVGGRIVLIGVLTGVSGDIPTALLMHKQAQIHGVTVGSRQHQIDMIRGLEASGVKPVIDRQFDLEELADAFRHEKAGEHFGKIVVRL